MDPIRYTVSFPAPQTHYVHIRAEYPTSGRSDLELSMAVWTPGSYLVREFSVEGIPHLLVNDGDTTFFDAERA